MTLFFFSLFFFIGPKYELNSEKDRKKVFRELRCNKYKMEEYFEKNTNYYYFLARKSEIIRLTEQILDAVNSGDFDSYTWVSFS